MSSDLPPPPPPPVPPRAPVVSPRPPSVPPPPASPGNTPSQPTGDTVPPLSFSLTPFPPPPPAATQPASPLPTAPSPTSSIPHSPPRQKLPPKARLVLIVGTTTLVLLIAAGLIWAHLRKRVPESELIAWLHAHSDAGLTIEKLTKTVTPRGDGSSLIKFEARGTVPAALYVRENTASHLRRTLDLSPASPSAVREAAASAADTRIRERAGISDTPVDPLETLVLRETTAAGTAFPFSGVATARRVDGHWRFSLLEGSLSSPALEGQPRATFGEKTYLAGNPGDDAALKQLVEKQTDSIARLGKAAAEIAEENKRDREFRLARFRELLTTGTLFTGRTTQGEGDPFSLEITAAKPGSDKITALLRLNSAGWLDARPFVGTWKLDDTTGIFSITITSRANQAIASAGPVLEGAAAITLALTLDDDGDLTSTPGSDIPLKASRITPEKLPVTKAKLTAALDDALAATQPGTIYHGTATAKTGGASEKVFLRFTKQTDHGAVLAASLESAETGNPWKRPLRGAIIDNTHRAGDEPIRLQMPGSGRSRSARSGTLFAHTTDTTPALKPDGSKLTGEDAAFTYEFTRVSAAQAATLKKAVEANSVAFAASFPRSSGVHVQIDDQWTALPRNGGSTSGGIGGFAKGLFSKNKDADKPLLLVFKGSTPPPVVSGEDLTLTFKGKLPSRAKGVATDYPLIEAARTATQEDIRTAPLERITPGFAGFGATRLAATIAQPAADILTLTFEQTLAPGTYAVLVGTDGYEFVVK